MSSFGPFGTRVGLLQRSVGLIDLITRNTPEVDQYRLRSSDTLNGAYGNLFGSGVAGAGTTARMDVPAGGRGQSITITRTGRGTDVSSRKGQTSFQFDPADYGIADDVMAFYRVQEHRITTGAWATVLAGPNAGTAIQGPILVVPSPINYGVSAISLSLQGMAPANTGSVAGANPHIDETVTIPLPMHIVLPRPASGVNIRNLDAGETLLVSFGLGMPMIQVPHGEVFSSSGGGYSPGASEIVLAAGGASSVPFTLDMIIGWEMI